MPGLKLRLNLCQIGSAVVVFVVLFSTNCAAAPAGQQEALHKRLLAGEYIRFNPGDPESLKTIDGAWIKEAVLKHVPIDLDGAIIGTTPIYLHAVTIDSEIHLLHCTVIFPVDFSYAVFRRPVEMGLTKFNYGMNLRNATFESTVVLSNLDIGAGGSFDSLHALNDFVLIESTFETRVLGAPSNLPRAAATFFFAQFHGNADLSGNDFKGDAVFYLARFDAQANFGDVKFHRAAVFDSAYFAGVAFFPGVVFRAGTIFNSAQFASGAFFGGAVFGDANFKGIAFGQKAEFTATRFEDVANFKKTTFNDGADFRGAAFQRWTTFDGATFKKAAEFDHAEISGPAFFTKTSFQKVSFEDATFRRDAYFTDTTFTKQVSFRETAFRTVFFSSDGMVSGSPQFLANIDLRGCVYDRIQTNWKLLLEYPDGHSRVQPYDRQPFIELEEVLRKSGLEREADAVYAQRRRIERRSLSFWPRIRETLYWLFANYGIDLWRESVIASGLLLLGALLFSRPGAVVPKSNVYAEETKISFLEGISLSVHAFLPFGLPVKPMWEPSRRRSGVPAAWANILRVCGWILVPLAVAFVTGVLRRVAP